MIYNTIYIYIHILSMIDVVIPMLAPPLYNNKKS